MENEGNDIKIEEWKALLKLPPVDPETYSPLALAFIGDSVYEMIIRTVILSRGNTQVNKLNKRTSNLAKAPTQAAMVKLIMDDLTERELAIFKRGRNAKSATVAKNASVTDYRYATGFEALIGYLYLSEQFTRLIHLVQLALARIGEN
ncbi:MAG: Mini-ribonuclease 3 [Lachnospiraceae bacterium]